MRPCKITVFVVEERMVAPGRLLFEARWRFILQAWSTACLPGMSHKSWEGSTKERPRCMYLSTNPSGVVHEILESMSHRRECLQGCALMVVLVLLFPIKWEYSSSCDLLDRILFQVCMVSAITPSWRWPGLKASLSFCNSLGEGLDVQGLYLCILCGEMGLM